MDGPAPVARAGAVRFSVVVPTFNRCEVLLRSLRALADLERPWPCEVVVVDDGSSDGTAEALQRVELPMPLRVVTQPNAGAAAARNRGAEQTEGEFLLFLDDDMIADHRLLVEHDKVLQRGADAVVGHIPLAPESTPSLLTDGVKRWAERRLERLRAAGHGPVPVADLLTGQLSVRATVFRASGGFDSSFTAGGTFGGEDVDFLYRLVRDGARVCAAPDAVSWQQYVVTPAAHLRQWRQGGHADAHLTRTHPVLGPTIKRQHHGSGPRGLLARAGAALPEAAKAALRERVATRATAGHADLVTRSLFTVARDLEYWSGVRDGGGLTCEQVHGVVLAYHAVEDVRDPLLRQYAVPPAEFSGQIHALLAAGFRFVGADAYLAHLDGAPLPPRSLLLTFDDGYASVYESAAPLLRELGIPAVVFLVTEQIAGTNAWDVARGGRALPLVDRQQIRDLEAQGFEVGSHSRTHGHLVALDAAGVESEVAGSRKDLDDLGVRPVRLIAYPHGEHDFRVRRSAERAGYRAAFGLAHGTAPAARYALPRLEVQRGEEPEALVQRILRTSPGASRQLRREAIAVVRSLHDASPGRRVPPPTRSTGAS